MIWPLKTDVLYWIIHFFILLQKNIENINTSNLLNQVMTLYESLNFMPAILFKSSFLPPIIHRLDSVLVTVNYANTYMDIWLTCFIYILQNTLQKKMSAAQILGTSWTLMA